MMNKKTVVSGMRPTGRLHLGNYHGALKNWVKLQEQYNCLFFVADYHSLTTAHDRTEELKTNSREMVVDWLTAGLSPEKCAIFIQSDLPQIGELNLLLGMITPLGVLLRNPTYKEQLIEFFKKKYAGQISSVKEEKTFSKDEAGQDVATHKITVAGKMAELSEEELSSLASIGFLNYPVLMATDIIIHGANFVPVGQDQVPHLEIARMLVRKFNEQYKTDVFTEPKALHTEVLKLPGLDGRKMSKSYNNTIELGEDVKSAEKKVMSMFTDPQKKRADDPGHPGNCVVYSYHKIYNPAYLRREEECKAGAVGCVACKRQLFALMEPEIAAFNARRAEIAKDSALIDKIIKDGAARAGDSASVYLYNAKKAMGLK